MAARFCSTFFRITASTWIASFIVRILSSLAPSAFSLHSLINFLVSGHVNAELSCTNPIRTELCRQTVLSSTQFPFTGVLIKPDQEGNKLMFLSEWCEFPSAPCLAGKQKTWWQLASWCCWNRARPRHASELVSFLVWLRTYQHSRVLKCLLYILCFPTDNFLDPLLIEVPNIMWNAFPASHEVAVSLMLMDTNGCSSQPSISCCR